MNKLFLLQEVSGRTRLSQTNNWQEYLQTNDNNSLEKRMRTDENEEEHSDDNSYNEYVNMEAVYFVAFFLTRISSIL